MNTLKRRKKPSSLVLILFIVIYGMTCHSYLCMAKPIIKREVTARNDLIKDALISSIEEGLDYIIEEPEETSSIQNYIENAQDLIEQGDIEGAFLQYNMAYKIEPFHAGLNAIFAFISATQGYEIEAREYIEIALSNLFYLEDDSRISFYWFILALAYDKLHQRSDAKLTLDLAIRNLSKSSDKYHSILAEGLELYEELDYPLACYSTLKGQPIKSWEVFEECAAEAFQNSEADREEIVKTYMNLAENYMTAIEKRRILAGWYMEANDEKKALELLYENMLSVETPYEDDIKQYNNYWYLALIDKYDKEFEGKEMVEEQLYILAKKYPGISGFRLQLASLFQEIGENEKAREEYKKILEEDPDNHTVLHQLGKLEYEAGHCMEALNYLSQYECSSKECLEIIYYQAKAYECNYDIANALASWERLKAMNYSSLDETEANSDANKSLIERVKEFLISIRTQIVNERERSYFAEADNRISRLQDYTKKEYQRIPSNLKDATKAILETLSIYNRANKMRMTGIEETKDNYEAFHNNPLFGSYNPSPDIYLAELIYHDCLSKAFLIQNMSEIEKARNLIIEATNQTTKGISLFAEGYYVKEIDYPAQFKKGEDMIAAGDKKIIKACRLILRLVQKYFLDFPLDIEIELNSYIDYYSRGI
ncbi:MAG: tetratricopeptide repeat protein [bacterium]